MYMWVGGGGGMDAEVCVYLLRHHCLNFIEYDIIIFCRIVMILCYPLLEMISYQVRNIAILLAINNFYFF